jgi:quercetin dioxygenase-like cupin family protein
MIGKTGGIIEEERGRIIPVAEGDFKAVMIIESKKGAIRANHYHKEDSHVMYLISGKARYVETLFADLTHVMLDREINPGDTIHTGPMIPHAMEFLEDSVMIVCTSNNRDYDSYMNDIVPVKML